MFFHINMHVDSPLGPTHVLCIWALVLEKDLQPQALESGLHLGMGVQKLVPACILSLGSPDRKPWNGGTGIVPCHLSSVRAPQETEAGNPIFSLSGGNWLAQRHAAAGVCHRRRLPHCRRWEAGSHPDPQRWPLPPGGQHVQKKQ